MKLRTKRCGFSWSVFFRHFEHHKPSAILFQFIVEKAGISMADYVEKNMYKYVSFFSVNCPFNISQFFLPALKFTFKFCSPTVVYPTHFRL